MEKVFFELFDALDEDHVSPEEQAALDQAEEICQTVREKLTLREFDAFWDAAVRVGTAEIKTSFARGFSLGARVMLAVLQGD